MGTDIDIIGLDHGYWFTKDNLHNKFKSAYSRINNTLTDTNKIIINDTTYYFGSGITTADTDKSDNIVTMVCTNAIFAMRNNTSCERYIVVGLPPAQYLSKKDSFAEAIMKYNDYEIVYNNACFKPNIKAVDVFAQGVGAMFKIGLDDGSYISFDVGSYTVNVALIEIINGLPHIIKFNTWFDGIMTLYDKIIKEVNQRFDLTLDIEYAEKILTSGLNVDGENQDVDFTKPIIRDYLENIFSKFKPNYPYAITPIILSGGGSIFLGNILTSCFQNSILLPDAQFANAMGYYNFGLQKYGHLLEGRCVNA